MPLRIDSQSRSTSINRDDEDYGDDDADDHYSYDDGDVASMSNGKELQEHNKRVGTVDHKSQEMSTYKQSYRIRQ